LKVENNTAHIQFEQGRDRESLLGSGNWALDNGTRSTGALAPRVFARRAPPVAWFGWVFTVVSSLVPGPDPWVEVQQQRAQVTMAGAFQPYRRRRISSLEARRLALEILYRAEAERAAIAEAEARRGIHWEEDS
jgi:hypothetical protein